MGTTGRRRVRLAALGILTATCAAAASAQTSAAVPAAPEAPQAGVAEEGTSATADIVVTAQKRAERAQDVPVSLAVATGGSLRGLNLNQATDLQYVVPGLGLGDANTPRGAGFRVRGVGTNVFADGIEQSVGTVLDGVPLARAGQGLGDLIDIERVEVLRGPQGMLFGRNASAGLINIITRKSSATPTGEALASYGSGDEVRSSATVSGPIAGGFGVRLTGFLNRQDGFVTDLTSGDRLNDRREYGVRGVIDGSLGERTDLTLRSDWSRRDVRGNIWTIRALPSTALAPIVSPGVRVAAGQRNDVVDLSGDVGAKQDSWGVSGEINQSLGGYTVTSLTAFRKWNQFDTNDADQSRLNVLDVNSGSNDLHQFSEELRLTSPADQFVSFVAGAFFYRSSNANVSTQVGRFAVSLARAAAAGVTAAGQSPQTLGGRQISSKVDVRDLAGFGQASVNFTPTFHAIVGGRYTSTRIDAAYARVTAPGASAAYNLLLGAGAAPIAYDLRTTDDNLSWRLGLQFEPSRSHNLYATVSRGYKGPGFDTQVDFTLQPGRTALESALVEPEIPTAYEVGYKAGLLDRRLDVSLAIYRSDFRNFQAQTFETPPGATLGSFRIRNAGKLRSQGFEIEFTARPTDGFSAGIGLAYNDSRYRRFAASACPRLPQLVTAANDGSNCGVGAISFNASGLRSPNAPRWTVSTNARYEADLRNGIGAFVQGNLYLRSDNFFATYPRSVPNISQQDGYAVVNGTLGASFLDKRVTIAGYVRNLFDQNFVTTIFDLSFGGPGDLGQFTTRDSRRSGGVQLGLRF